MKQDLNLDLELLFDTALFGFDSIYLLLSLLTCKILVERNKLSLYLLLSTEVRKK